MIEQRSMAIYSFSEVLQYLKIGHKAKRHDWDDNISIFYDEYMGTIYKTVGETTAPWEAPQKDLLAEDWLVIKNVG
ncbi:MAG: MW1434 family type I TA system toxin [Clostridia bacterium]